MKPEIDKSFMNAEEVMRQLMTVPSYTIGKFTFDVLSQQLKIDNESVKLTTKESYLLVYFAANANRLMTPGEILMAVWGEYSFRKGRSLDVYLCKLRKLLSKDPGISIVNTHGKGFEMRIR